MAEHRTADEVRQEHESKMKAALGAEFHRLWNECNWLHLKWRDYAALYGTSPARVDLLNSAAGGFFMLVERTMWLDLLLHVCRLTDQPTTGARGRRERLSILRLTSQVDPAIHDKVRGLVSKAIKKSKFARDWRDRHIAHTDLRLALEKGAKPLKPASRKRAKEAIGAIVDVLSAVETHYCKTSTGYEHGSLLGDGEALLHVLRDGVESRAELHRQLMEGEDPAGRLRQEADLIYPPPSWRRCCARTGPGHPVDLGERFRLRKKQHEAVCWLRTLPGKLMRPIDWRVRGVNTGGRFNCRRAA